MKIDEIIKISGKTREEIQSILSKQEFMEIKLTER